MTTVINGTSTSASAPAVVGDDSDTGLYFPSANVLALATGGSERARVDSSGNIQIGQSVDTFPGAGNTVTGGGITGTGRISFSAAGVPVAYFNRNTDDGELVSFRRQGSGVGAINATTTGVTLTGTNGITFTASQTASADANTLDDYEEGTWTPLVQNVSASESVTLSNASYIKVGRLVYVNITSYATNTSAITASSHMYIRGLPFSAGDKNGNPCYIQSVMSQYPSNVVSIIDLSGTAAPLYTVGGAQDWNPFTRNSWGGASSISWRMSFCYYATS